MFFKTFKILPNKVTLCYNGLVMSGKIWREIYYFKHFYLEFFNALKPEVQKKFNWTLQLIATVEMVPRKYFDHITNSDGLFEIRVESGG